MAPGRTRDAERVRGRPAKARTLAGGEIDGARPGQEVAGAIADLIGGRALRQLLVRQRLDAIGVDDDVLRGGEEGGDHAPQREAADVVDRIARAELDDRDHKQHLDRPQPSAPLSKETTEHWNGDAIDQRRPQELQRVGCAQGEREADRLLVDADLRQPIGHRPDQQGQREAARNAQEERAQRAWSQVGKGKRAERLGVAGGRSCH